MLWDHILFITMHYICRKNIKSKVHVHVRFMDIHVLFLRLPKEHGEHRPPPLTEIPQKAGFCGNSRLCSEESFVAFIQVCTLKQNFNVIKYRTRSNELCNFLNSFYEEGSCLHLSPPFAANVLLSAFHSLRL